MNKLSINLLPPELNISTQNSVKKKLIFRTSVVFLSLTILTTIVLLSLVLGSNVKLNKIEDTYVLLKDKLALLKENEYFASILKGRLTSINSVVQKPSSEVDAYNLITLLMPQGIIMQNFSLDKSKKILLSAETSNPVLLDNFFNKLTDPKSHDGRIQSTKLTNLNVGAGRIKFDLMVLLAK